MFDSIMHGLTEDVAYEKGENTARSVSVTIAPLSEVSADEVKALRQSLHMTQRTFAALMGISNKTVEALKKGTNAPAGTARLIMRMLLKDHSIPEKYNIIIR